MNERRGIERRVWELEVEKMQTVKEKNDRH